MPKGVYNHKNNYILTPKRLEHIKAVGFKKGHKDFVSDNGRKQQAVKMKGENNPKWIIDRGLVKQQDKRISPIYKQWRYQIFKRDRHICKINNEDCSGALEAHHILSWKDYPELRYEINNGITLCHYHHPKTRDGEIKLIQTFQGLVMQVN